MKKKDWRFIGLSLQILFILFAVGMSYFGQNYVPINSKIPVHNGGLGNIDLKVNVVPVNQSSIIENMIKFRTSDLAEIQVIQSNSERIEKVEQDSSLNPINPIIIMIMIVAGAVSSYTINLFIISYRKEQKFRYIARKVLNETEFIYFTPIFSSQPDSYDFTESNAPQIEEIPSIPIFLDSDPPITTQPLFSYDISNQNGEFEPALVFKGIIEEPEMISYDELFNVMNTILKLFPPLNGYFKENLLLYLKDLIKLPGSEVFSFLIALIEKISESELRQGINKLIYNFKKTELINETADVLGPQITKLFKSIELVQNRRLLDSLSVFLILSIVQLVGLKLNSY